MTKRDPFPTPSDTELRILKVLWERGPATSKLINEQLYNGTKKPRVITTTLKQLEIMMDKKLVKRDDAKSPHIYRANVPKDAVLRRVVTQTLNDVFDQSASQFMLAAIESGAVGPSDIAEIKALLEEYEGINSKSEVRNKSQS
jgi:predicted transcriptional regulator